jgi:pimeloyl-ACP methyl ester carboxylesterase
MTIDQTELSAGRKKHRRRVLRYLAITLVVCLATGGTFTYTSFKSDMDTAYARIAKIPMEVFKGHHGDIEYMLSGEGQTILISHGVTGGIDQGMHLTDEFAFFDKGYRFLYVSRFGYLKSSLPKNASAETQAAAYKELLDHLGIKKLFVFGNSAGGSSAMWFAIDYPEFTKGLILHSSAIPGPLLPPPPTIIFESNFLYWAAIKAAPDMLIGILVPKNILTTITKEEKAFLIQNAYLAALPITERTEGIIFDNETSTPSVNQIPFERIKAPTLILQATDDPREKAGGEELARRIPNSDYVRLKGGHLLLRQANKVRFEIAQFILAHQ